jgi:hypothetical protein
MIEGVDSHLETRLSVHSRHTYDTQGLGLFQPLSRAAVSPQVIGKARKHWGGDLPLHPVVSFLRASNLGAAGSSPAGRADSLDRPGDRERQLYVH